MSRNITRISAIIGALLAGPLLAIAAGSWTPAPGTPPGNNTDAPINVGSQGQSKEAGLMVNAGNLGADGLLVPFGRTGLGTANPSTKLEVRDTSAGTVAKFSGGDANGMEIDLKADTNGGYEYKLGVTDSSHPWGSGFYLYNTVKSERQIFVDGDTGGIYGNAYFYQSDRNLKTNIAPLSDALSKVLQLSGVSFNWKKTGEPSVGVIAQDVEKVYPELVSTDPASGIKSVEYGNLVAPLIEAVKAQQREIDALKAEVAALKQNR